MKPFLDRICFHKQRNSSNKCKVFSILVAHLRQRWSKESRKQIIMASVTVMSILNVPLHLYIFSTKMTVSLLDIFFIVTKMQSSCKRCTSANKMFIHHCASRASSVRPPYPTDKSGTNWRKAGAGDSGVKWTLTETGRIIPKDAELRCLWNPLLIYTGSSSSSCTVSESKLWF